MKNLRKAVSIKQTAAKIRKTEAPMRLFKGRKHIPTKKLHDHEERDPNAIAEDLGLTSKSSVGKNLKISHYLTMLKNKSLI